MVKNLSRKAGDAKGAGLIPGLGRSPGEGNGNPLQYSCLENSMDRGAWRAIIHGAVTEHTHLYALDRVLGTSQVRGMVVESANPRVRWIQVSARLLPNCEILAQLLHLSVPPLSHL